MLTAREELNGRYPRPAAFQSFHTGVLRGADAPVRVEMNVEGVTHLWLVVDSTADGNGADQAVWGEPVLVAKDGTRTPLIKTPLVWFRVGYGSRPKFNHNHLREPLSFGERKLTDGLWAHGPSAMCFGIGGQFVRFEALVGLDTASGDRGSVRFSVDCRSPDLVRPVWNRLEQAFPMEADWWMQDAGDSMFAWFWQNDGVEIEKVIIGKAAAESGPAAAAIRSGLEELARSNAPPDDQRWLALYAKACTARRARRLKPLRDAFKCVVFVKYDDRAITGANHFAYTESLSDTRAHGYFTFRPGSALCVLELDGARARVRELLRDDGGVIRDPDVSFDGERILFAWKKSAKKDDYHLYEMTIASRVVRQLTSGLGYADFEPIYLPDGNILFNSSRCVQEVDCDVNEVSNLYLCDGDGRYMRRVGFDQVHTNFPSLLDDGRVIFTRWDYNDRSQIWPQGLIQMNPDGTGQTEFYGNNSWFPTSILHARGIPGTSKVLAVLGGHHAHQRGKLAVIDRRKGQQEAEGVQLVAPVRKTEAVRVDSYGQDGEQFKYPYPISETAYLVSYTPHHLGNRNYARPFWLYFMDADGRRELLAADRARGCYHAVPLAPRKRPHVRPGDVDYREAKGIFFLQDVHLGPGLAGIPRGTVKELRVVAMVLRPANVGGAVGTSGPGGGSVQHSPVAIGNGTYDVKKVLGSATVYEDGSACFEAPPREPVYFQAIDARGHVVQSMRSWSTLQPGEWLGCAGCHESKSIAPPVRHVAIAMKKGPQKLKPFYGPPRGFSFPREIQPILDSRCIDCHHRGKDAKAFSLSGEPNPPGPAKRAWSDAYIALTRPKNDIGQPNEIVNWLNVQSVPSMLPPYHAGAAKSKLITMLEDGHGDVKLSREEMDKIACWIDLLVPFCGDYAEANTWNDAEKQEFEYYRAKRQRAEAEERGNIEALLGKESGVVLGTHSRWEASQQSAK